MSLHLISRSGAWIPPLSILDTSWRNIAFQVVPPVRLSYQLVEPVVKPRFPLVGSKAEVLQAPRSAVSWTIPHLLQQRAPLRQRIWRAGVARKQLAFEAFCSQAAELPDS